MPAPATMTQICCLPKLRVVALEAQKPKPTAAMAQPMTTARLAPSRSSMRPPIWAAITKPRKKNRRKSPACDAVLCRAIWAYSLAKKKTGMKAIMAISSTRFSDREGADAEDGDLDERRLGAELGQDEDHEDGEPANDADPGPGVAPAPQHGLLQAEDAEPDAGGDEDGAPVVDRGPLVLGLGLRHGNQGQRDEGDRDVHPEDGPPRPLGQVAPQDRSDRGQPAGDPEEQGERLATLAQGEHVDDDGEGGREHEGTAGALDDPEPHDPRLGHRAGGSEAAHGRRPDEHDHADDAHLGVAEDVREPSAQREQRGEGDQVAVHHPLHPGRRKAELALDVRHGDGDDRLVDERHGDREDHCGEHPVASLHAAAAHGALPAGSSRSG